MPVRKRGNKRQPGSDAWLTFLETGFDLFGDLKALGIDEPIPMETAQEAWQRHREQLREEWAVSRHPSLGPAWAERVFE